MTYTPLGIHPHEAKDAPEKYLTQISKYSKHSKVVAIGEIVLIIIIIFQIL